MFDAEKTSVGIILLNSKKNPLKLSGVITCGQAIPVGMAWRGPRQEPSAIRETGKTATRTATP